MSAAEPLILIVEDEYLVALEVELLVRQCGCEVAGPVGTIGDALEAARAAEIDGAIIDVNIEGERIWPVADVLRERRIPFVLATGYSRADVPERFGKVAVVTKPFTLAMLSAALQAIRPATA